MLIGARTAAWSKSLPYDEELVYLRSNGNQYIDTGIVAKTAVSMYIDLDYYDTGTDIAFCGAKGTGNNRFVLGYYQASGNGIYFGYADAQMTLGTKSDPVYGSNYKVNCSCSGGGRIAFSCNSVSQSAVSTVTTIDSSKSIILFAREWNGNVNAFSKIAVRAFEITRDGTKVIDFLPVLKNGIPCMYNKETGGFFYNQAAGHQFGYLRKNGTEVAPT